MLFTIGPVQMDTRPFNVDEWDREGAADFATKPVMGVPPRREFMGEGEGDETLTVRGQLLPTRIGGLTELETLQGFRRAGRALPVMRGDGVMMGWFVITRIEERHEDLERDGRGFVANYSVEMVKSDPANAAPNLIGTMHSLFDLLRR